MGTPRIEANTVETPHMTITEALSLFLAEQQDRLGAKTFSHYRSTVELLSLSLDSYAANGLRPAEAKRFERFEGDSFCDFFGPKYILPNLHEFLNYFMVRKVLAGQAQLRAAGTVTKKLVQWLAKKGYADAEDSMNASDMASVATHDLPNAEQLCASLYEHTESNHAGRQDGDLEDHFEIVRVEAGKLWLEGIIEGGPYGPIKLPVSLTERCKLGWKISGALGQRRGKWHLLEVWNVYPA